METQASFPAFNNKVENAIADRRRQISIKIESLN